MITPEDAMLVAQTVVDLLRGEAPTSKDRWLNRPEAAKYLSISPRSFDRLREEEPKFLRPASEHPLRWSCSQLELYKAYKNQALQAQIRNPIPRRRSPNGTRSAATQTLSQSENAPGVPLATHPSNTP